MKPIITALALALPCHAAVSFSLPGSSESAAWTGLNGTNYTSAAGFPSYPTATNPWPNSLTPDSGFTLDSEFNKVSGGGYFASSSIYDSGIPGTFRMTSLTAMANLETVVMQADVGALLGGAPVLSYNGGTQQLVADFSGNSAGNFVANNFDGSTTPSTNQAWQWDLSGLGETITEYSVEWSTAAHGTVYEVNLAEGNSFAQVVPEPSVPLLALLSSSLLFRRRRDC